MLQYTIQRDNNYDSDKMFTSQFELMNVRPKNGNFIFDRYIFGLSKLTIPYDQREENDDVMQCVKYESQINLFNFLKHSLFCCPLYLTQLSANV